MGQVFVQMACIYLGEKKVRNERNPARVSVRVC